tara:strand:+ start:761 stop:1345 length:585 start_codon:yes stop_codon:yes gene_type:complete
MVKLIGGNKIRTAVFISGSGSNLKNLIKFSLLKNCPIKIIYVVSSNKNAKGLDHAKKYKIKNQVFEFKRKTEDEDKILKNLKRNKIDLICLAGFMKILSGKFIKKSKTTILNIHPSLLPKYKGLNTHKRVIKNKERYSGCTVHYVNSKLDSGQIILQKKVKILKSDTPNKLAKKILIQEHLLYPKAIKKLFFSL